MQSVEYGVTAMRAHVEVDETVAVTCLDIGLRLKQEYFSICDIQVAGRCKCCLDTPTL